VIPRDVSVKADDSAKMSPPTSPTIPQAALAHPPRSRQPAAVYYLPAKLTAAQEKFLAEQKAAVAHVAAEEMKEWTVDRKKGLEEVVELRKKAEESRADADMHVDKDSQQQPLPPVRRRSSSTGVDKTDMEKVGHASVDDDALPKEMDTEDTIEY